MRARGRSRLPGAERVSHSLFQRRSRERADHSREIGSERRRRRASAERHGALHARATLRQTPTAFRWTQSARAPCTPCAPPSPAPFAAPVSRRAARRTASSARSVTCDGSPRENLSRLALRDSLQPLASAIRTPRRPRARRARGERRATWTNRDARARPSARAARRGGAMKTRKRRDRCARARRPNGARATTATAKTRRRAMRDERCSRSRERRKRRRGRREGGSFIKSCGRAATGGACFGRSRSV